MLAELDVSFRICVTSTAVTALAVSPRRTPEQIEWLKWPVRIFCAVGSWLCLEARPGSYRFCEILRHPSLSEVHRTHLIQ